MDFLHLANDGLLLYFNGNSRSYCNSKKSIKLYFVQNVHVQMIDKHNAMIYFSFIGEAEDPACIPIFWISKWVDYSDKYGLGKTPCWHWHTQANIQTGMY